MPFCKKLKKKLCGRGMDCNEDFYSFNNYICCFNIVQFVEQYIDGYDKKIEKI